MITHFKIFGSKWRFLPLVYGIVAALFAVMPTKAMAGQVDRSMCDRIWQRCMIAAFLAQEDCIDDGGVPEICIQFADDQRNSCDAQKQECEEKLTR